MGLRWTWEFASTMRACGPGGLRAPTGCAGARVTRGQCGLALSFGTQPPGASPRVRPSPIWSRCVVLLLSQKTPGVVAFVVHRRHHTGRAGGRALVRPPPHAHTPRRGVGTGAARRPDRTALIAEGGFQPRVFADASTPALLSLGDPRSSKTETNYRKVAGYRDRMPVFSQRETCDPSTG